MLSDYGFQIETDRIKAAVVDAEKMKAWIPAHAVEVQYFEVQLAKQMEKCMQGGVEGNVARERIWGKYHRLRVSEAYVNFWRTFLRVAGCNLIEDPIVSQYLIPLHIQTSGKRYLSRLQASVLLYLTRNKM